MRRFLVKLVLAASFLVGTLLGAQDVMTTVAESDHGPRFFMSAPNGLVALDVVRTPVLRRRVSIHVHRASLRDVLGQIASQAGLSLSFSPDVISLEAPVSLDAKDLTVAAALTELLMDLRVDLV